MEITIPDSGGNVDLTGYATEQWVKDQKYLTEVPEGYAKTKDIPTKAEDIGALPNTYTPPNQTAEQVGADPKGTASTAVSQHNTADDSHTDIRLELKAINDRLTAFFNSDNQTLDELSEIVAYITSNKTLIDSITTSKVSVTDIINNLTTNVSNKPLSAAQGVVLKDLIDSLSGSLANYQPKGNYALASAVPTKVSQLENDKGYLTAADAVPDYVKTAAEAVVGKTASAQTGRTFTFAAISDMHYGSWGYYEGVTDYRDGVNHACQALKYIDERIKLDAVAVLGDYTDGMAQTQQGTAVADFKGVNAVLDKLRFAPNLRLQGNHDFVAEKSPLAYRYIGAYSDGAVEWGNPLGGYFYKDFSAQKIRVICLNTSEASNEYLSCSVEQYEWFIDSLDLSAKADASEWRILILSHIPLDAWPGSGGAYRFAYILDAYNNGTNWSDDAVSCDFSNGKNAAILVGCIHGHVHNFKMDKLYLGNIEGNPPQTNVWRLATPNACFGAENKNYTGYQEETAYPKTANSATDTAFCVYCIDLDNHTIKAICYGAGYDRELTYYTEPVAIANALKNSTEADGVTPYNGGQGWKAETRWSGSSDAEQTPYSGVSLSGYIAYDGKAGKVYMKNVSTTSRIVVWYFQKSGMPGEAWKRDGANALPNVTYDESGNVASFDLEAYCDYIRIECGGFTADSIITINQPIE